MTLLPCSPCCCPCPNAPEECLQLTLSGFNGDAEECDECVYLDGTYVLKREPLNTPTATATIVAGTGAGATLTATLSKNESGGYYTISSIAVTAAGSNYPEDASVSVSGLSPGCGDSPVLQAVVVNGSIASVSVVDGGKFYTSPCEWRWLGCPVCPNNQQTFSSSHAGLEVRFVLAGSVATIRAALGQIVTNQNTGNRTFVAGTVIYEASSAVPSEPWGSLTLLSTDASVLCNTTGTATIEPISCLTENGCGDCCLPDQISLTTRGWGAAIGWISQNGGSPGIFACPNDAPAGGWGNVFCGACGEETPEDGCRVRFGGTQSGPANYSVFQLGTNGSGILDRVHPNTYQPWKPGDPCVPVMYIGPMPAMPIAGGSPVNVQCAGSPHAANVTLSHIDLTSSVSISSPTKDPAGTTATAEISKITSGGITNVSLTDGGSGYAAEIMLRVLPEVTVSISTTSGSGAIIEATLEETTDFNGDTVWAVDSLSITDGGTGYGPDDSVEIAPAAGSLGYPVYASITIDRAEPAALTASATGGSGAVLVPVLTKGTDYYGQDYWAVSSVTVTDGGTGYNDGDPVTFSGSFERYAATATVTVEDGEIVSVNVTYGGEYFDTDGIIQTVTIGFYGNGEFYKLEGTGTVTVDTPSVAFASASGSGATATAVVDDDLNSPTFGKILSVTVTAAGENYYFGGKGWVAYVAGVYGLIHRDECLIDPAGFSGPCDDPEWAAQLEASGNGNCIDILQAKTFLSARVTGAVCPTSLLSRTYPMAFKANIFPYGYDNICGAGYCISGPFNNILTVASWGVDDPLEVEISGA